MKSEDSGGAQPVLLTRRLRLRSFTMTDVVSLVELANDPDVALNTLNIPHPYDRRDAEDWIASHAGQVERGEAFPYAVTEREGAALVGAVGLILDPANDAAELGYWIGRKYWGRGYATESARAVVAWAFDTLAIHRVHAGHFPRNPASGRVLRKLGMRHEGTLRQHVKKGGGYLDLEKYGLLRGELQDPP